MKSNIFTIIGLCALTLGLGSCSKKNDNPAAADPNTGVIFANTGDQVGRPGIATVFVSAADKDSFNATVPTSQAASFQTKFVTQLQAYNGGGFTTNILGLNAAGFMGVLSTDVLNVNLSGKTTYYDGTNVLTGRNLTDDVIDVSLTLIFGGPTGGSNPTLTSDHVAANDKVFLTTFPYEAAPW